MLPLQELRAFLVQRRLELRSSGNELLSALLPEAVQAVDAAAVTNLLAAVDAALGALTGPKLRQLLMIKTSQKWVCGTRAVSRVASCSKLDLQVVRKWRGHLQGQDWWHTWSVTLWDLT